MKLPPAGSDAEETGDAMNQDFEKELQRAEREKARAQRADSFWNAFQLTENGHVKMVM